MNAREELISFCLAALPNEAGFAKADTLADAFRDEVLRGERTDRVPSLWECMNGPAEDEPFCEDGDVHGDTDCPMVRVHRDDVDKFGAIVDEVHEQAKEIDRLQSLTSAWRDQLIKVEEFCAKRAEYITAIVNCHPDNAADYHRWQGHAESRRQLSELMGLPTAWPAGHNSERGEDR